MCLNCSHYAEVSQGYYLLSGTNTAPGAAFEVGVSVIAKGDTLATMAHRFNIRSADILAINPGLNPKKLRVGQQIRIYERRKYQDRMAY